MLNHFKRDDFFGMIAEIIIAGDVEVQVFVLIRKNSVMDIAFGAFTDLGGGSGIGYIVWFSSVDRKGEMSAKGLQVLGMSERLSC
jgi:hypothetical protein